MRVPTLPEAALAPQFADGHMVNGVDVHYVENLVTGAVDNFRFVMQR